MREQLDKFASIFPWLGLILIVAGLVAWFVTRTFDLLPNLLIIAGILLLALFAVLRPYQIRELFGARKTKYGVSALLATLFVAGIGIILYWLAYQNSDWRVDLTETNEFTPLPETIELLENLDEPVKAIGFYTAQNSFQQTQADSFLKNLTSASSKFSYEFKDPELFPLEAEKYDLNFDGTLVFVKGDDSSKATAVSDREIHTALVKVVNPVAKKLYLLSGHGGFDKEAFDEFGIATAISFVEDQGFEVENLNLFSAGEVPADATVVALINQEVPMSAEEVSALQSYLQSGGTMYIARDALAIDETGQAPAETDGIAGMLQTDWGVTIRNDIIIDPAMAQAGLPIGFTFVGLEYGNSPIIDDDLKNIGVLFNVSRSILHEAVPNVVATDLILTSDQAWGESDIGLLAAEGAVNPDPEDAQGSLSVIASLENTETGGRLVVTGDSDYITNQAISSGGNIFLFANALNWLADDEISIELTARDQISRQIIVQETQMRFLRIISIWLGPVIMLIAGIFTWNSRRNRQ